MFFSLLPVKKAIVGHLFQLSANSGNKSVVLAWMWVMWKHLIRGSWQLAILGHRLALSWSNPSPRWLCMSLLNHYPSAVQGKWGLAHYMLRVNLLQAIRSLPILCFPLSVIHICSLTTTLTIASVTTYDLCCWTTANFGSVCECFSYSWAV